MPQSSYLAEQERRALQLEQQAEQNQREAEQAQRQQQIEQARAQRAAEKTQNDAAKEAQRQQNTALEAQYQATDRPQYTDAYGNIRPQHDDATWTAEQAAKKKAAEDALKYKTEGRKHTKNPVDGSTIPLQTDEELAKQKADRAEMLRRRAIDEEVRGLRTEADNPDIQKDRLTEAAKVRAAKQLAKAQDDARYALQAKVGQTAKTVTGGDDWVPFNEQPAPEALAATERLKRLQDPAQDLTAEDLAELSTDPLTKTLADRITNTRNRIAKGDAANKFHEERSAKIWDAEMRRDNPAKWAQMQQEKLSDPKAIEAGAQDFETRRAKHEADVMPIAARRQKFEQDVSTLEAQNAQRVASGIPAHDVVTLTSPDGTSQTWSKELAAKRAALTAQHQNWETENADHLETLDIQGRQLNEQATLLNGAAQTANTQSQTTAAAQRAEQIEAIRSTPGLSRHADQIAGLDQEAAIRAADVNEMYPQDGPEKQAALDAIQQDVATKHQAISQEMQARQQTVQQVYQGMTGAEIEAGKAGAGHQPEHRDAAILALEQSLGMSRQEASTMLDDAQKQDWRGAGTAREEGDLVLKGLRAVGIKGQPGTDYVESEPTRILSTGAISVNPKLLTDPKGYEKAVMAANATTEAKAAAMKALPDARRELGKQALTVFNEYGGSGFKEWLAKKPDLAKADPIDQALAYADHLRADTGPIGRLLDQVVRRSATGIMSLGSQILGLGALATGSETLARGAGAIDDYVGLSRQMQDFTGANDSLLNRAVGQTAEIAPSMLVSLGGGMAARGALIAVTKTRPGMALLAGMSKSLRTAKTTEQATAAFGKIAEGAALAGAGIAGGAQTAGAQFSETYASLRDQGMGHEDAVKASRAPALLSGAVTALLTLGFGKTGVERLLANPEAAKTAARGRFAAILKKAGLSDRAAGVMAAAGKGALEEQPEEILDELFNQVSTELVKGNGASIQSVLADFIDHLPELAIAIGVMGGAAGGVQGYRETTVNNGQPSSTTVNPANMPEAVAAAEAAIDSFAPPDITPEVQARTQDAARSILYIAQGTPLTDLPADSLTALDIVEDPKNPGTFINGRIVAGKDGATKLVKFEGGQVSDPATGALRPVRVRMQDGQPIITQTTLDNLERLMPAVRAAIPLDENTRKQQLTAPAAGSQPTSTPANAPQDSVQAPPAAGPQPARSEETPVSDVTPAPELDAPSRKRAVELANALVDLGLPDGPAASVAAAIVAKHGVVGDLYTEQFVSKEFRQAAQELGLSGAWSTTKSKENPLKAPPDLDARLASFSGSQTIAQPSSTTAQPAPASPPATAPLAPRATSQPQATPEKTGPTSPSSTSGQGPVPPAMGGGSVPQGGAPAVPADASPALNPVAHDTEAFMMARKAALGKVPVADRPKAIRLFAALDKALTAYGPAFPEIRYIAPGGKGALGYQGIGIRVLLNLETGSITALEVNLPELVSGMSNMDPRAYNRILDKAVKHELRHVIAGRVIKPDEARALWKSMPLSIRQRVYASYHHADILNLLDLKGKDKATWKKHLDAAAKAMLDKQPVPLLRDGETMPRPDAFAMAHEFLRMLDESNDGNGQFAGEISEAADADPSWGEAVVRFLKSVMAEIKRLIDTDLDQNTRVTLRELETRIEKARKKLLADIKALETAPRTTTQPNLASGTDNRASVISKGSADTPVRSDFKPVNGATGTAFTDSNDAIEFQWAVVDVNSATISNRDDGSIDPAYPQELQPRDRQSAGSEAQVADIAKNFNLDRLSASNSVGDGAPILGPDGVVESGNGRMMGARRAYGSAGTPARSYREALLKRAAEFGLNAEQVEAVKNPVLVRIRKTEVNRPQFVLAANVSTIAPKRDIEQAKIDAKQIVPDLFESFVPSEDGEVFTAANAEFIKGFISAVVPPAERPGVIDASGNLSQSGLRRLRNALFVHAYGASPEALNALGRLTESIDATDTNIARALVAMAPRFAEQNARIANGALQPLSITEELTAALQTLTDLRNRGEKVSDWLLQDRIPGIGDDPGPVATALVQYLFDNRQRPRQIIEALDRYAKAVDSAGDPRQMSMFGDEKPTKQELWKLASKSAGKEAVLASGSKAMPPAAALKVFRKLLAAQEAGELQPGQARALETAEAALGQSFLFDDPTTRVLKPAEDLRLETQTTGKVKPTGEQLSLFSPTRAMSFEQALRQKHEASRRMEGELSPAFRAAVEESERTGQTPQYPGLPNARPSPDLDRDSRIVEARFFQQIAQNPTAAMGAYMRLAKEEFGHPRYLNADLARSVLPEYAQFSWFRTAFDAATLAPAGYITLGLLYPRFLTQRKNASLNQVWMLAGGPSSGKTTVANDRLKQALNKSVAIVDSVMGTRGGADYLIQTALNAGIRPNVAFIYRPFADAALHALKRLVQTGRPVNVEATAYLHYEAQKTFIELTETRTADTNFMVLVNDGTLDDIREESIDFLRNRAYYLSDETHDKLARSYGRIVDSEYDQGGITEAEYAAARWGRVDAEDSGRLKGRARSGEGQDGEGSTPAEGLVSLAKSKTAPADTGLDLFSFNSGMGLSTLLTPAQNDAKLQQAANLDLFGNEKPRPPAKRPAKPAAPSGSQKPAAQPPSFDDLFAGPGLAGGGPRGERPLGDLDRPGLAGGAGTGGNNADGGAETSGPGTDTGTADRPQDGTGNGLSGLPGDAGNPDARLQRRPSVGSPARNFEADPEVESLSPKGDRAKILANKEAIILLKKLEEDKRNATPEEKKVLAAYTGWGAFREAFNKKYEGDIRRYWDGKSETYREDYMPDFLKSWEKNHRATHKTLVENMTEEEFDSAAASTLNAHYTAAPIIRSMWKMVERLGFKGGRALEPSAGNGHYLGLQPQGDTANRTHWQTVELDELSARLLAKLYPEAAVNEHLGGIEGRSVTGLGFERARIPNGSLDLIISNVPFHESGPHKKGFPKLNLHNFFFAHALDKAKPGGIVAFITSESTMQNNIKERDFIASKGDLVAAFRLPNNAFKANAGTEVTTDIILIRKRDDTPFKGKDWRNLVEVGRQTITMKQKNGQLVADFRREAERKGEIVREYGSNGEKRIDVSAPIMVNEYFVNHPQNVMGQHTLAGTMYQAGAYAVVAPDGMDVMATLNSLVPSLPENIMGRQSTADTPDIVLAGQGDKPFSHVERDGKIYEVQPDGSMEEAEWSTSPELIRNWRSWKGVQQAAQELVTMSNVATADEANLDRMRKRLNLLYDTHIATHGAISKKFANKHTHLYGDPGYPLTSALEDEVIKLDPKTGKKTYSYKKADILTKRITPPVAEPEKARDIDDAVEISMAWRGGIQPAFMASLLNTSIEAINRQLDAMPSIYEDPLTNTYETAETYLAGNLRTKLDAAEEASKDNPTFDKNVSAIRAAMPARKSIGRITPTLGARWIPSEVYNAFIKEVLAGNDTVEYIPAGNMWAFTGTGLFRTEDHGTERVGPYSLMKHALNMTEPLVYDGSGDDRVVNHTETAAARAALDKLKAAFVTFVKTSEAPVTREAGGPEMPVWQASEEAFNEVNNSYVNPQHKGDYLKFPNLNTDYVYIKPFRRSVIARFISLARGMMAHGVGSGKTFNQIILAYELKRLGKAQKPMIVVQNATLGQFVKSYMKAYPTARVLVPTKKDFEQQNRRRLVAKIATGNWDTVIMPHSQFDLISNKPEAVKAYMDSQIQELYEIITRTRDESKVRDLQGILKRLRDRRQKMLDKLAARADVAVFWEDLGVDAIIMDEAHNYKSLPIVTRMGRVKGVPSSGDSQRAINFMLKVRNVQAKMGGKNIFLATGTPVKNSMAEAYIMMQYMAPDILADYKIFNFDDFATSFGQMVTAPEMAWSGTPKMESRFVKFQNGPALITMIRSMFDVAFGNEALGLDVPAIVGGEPEMVIVPATPLNEQFNAWVRSVGERWKNASGEEKEEYGAAPIQTMAAGIAAALDPRLISPNLPDLPGSKVNTAIGRVLEIYKKGHARKTTQAIFSDLRNPFSMDYLVPFTGHPFPEHGSAGEFDLYHDIKKKLIAGGMKESEILLMESGFSDKKKTDLFERVNKGEFRVVIGSTELLGVGVNIQERLKAVHHLMPPRDFTPAMQEQRNGRIIRQGNMHAAKVDGQPAWNEPVHIINFGTEKSMDSAIYGALARKQRAVTQLLMGEDTADVFDDPTDPSAVNLAEMAARTLGDVDFIRKIELEKEVKDLRLLRDAFASESGGRRSRLLRTEQEIKAVPGYLADIQKARENQRNRWVRTAPRPEGVRETTDIADKAVYEFDDQTIDTAAPKNNAITLPLDLWLLDLSKTMERRGQKRFQTSFNVNGHPVFIEVHTTNEGQETPGYILEHADSTGGTPFRGAASLLMSLHVPDAHYDMMTRQYERALEDGQITVKKLRESIANAPTEFPDAKKLDELEAEMEAVDARLAAKTAPPTPPPSTTGGGSGSGTTVNGVELPEMTAPDPDLMTDEVVDAIDNAVIMANRLTLPTTLDRKLYVKVNAALESAGGRWSKKAKAHMFRGDPGPLFGFPPQPGMEPVPEERDLSDTPPTLKGPPREAPLAHGTKSAYPISQSPSLIVSPSSYATAPIDPHTGARSLITGSRVTREQGQAIGARHAERLRRGLREGREGGQSGPALAASRSGAFVVPVLSPEQFDRLTALDEIGEGSEAVVYADKAAGVVYKVLSGHQKSPILGIWPDVYYTASGRLDYRFQPATRPRQLAARIAVQTLIGGTPTEIAGVGPKGQVILKQPLSPDPWSVYDQDMRKSLKDAGIVAIPPEIYSDDIPAYVAVVEGRPWLITDIRLDNLVLDNHGSARLNDPVVAHIPMEMIPRVPGLAAVITAAGQQATRLGDRSARLFASAKSTAQPPLNNGSTTSSPSPLARLGWNHLDRSASAKLAALARWTNDKTHAGELVAKWQGNPNIAPFMGLGKLVKRELFPDSVLPREIAAKKREMEIKTALGAQRGMDLVRALSGQPKFSDLVYPPAFAQNPMYRRNLYLAMAGEMPMSSLPKELQDLAARLREMLVDMGREAVKQGRMSTDTFANLQAGYMPHFYKEDVQKEKSLFHRFRLGLRDILAQRTTAWHITDLQNKDQTGEPRLVSWQGNQWRFRNQEHRDAFFEDFLLQQALEQITSRGGRKNRTLTITDLRAPAALDAETRGRLAEINRGLRMRYKKERPLSVDEQEKAGLIMDPVYAIARYTAQMVHDNSTAEFFNFVAANTEWTSDNATPGFTEIPDNPRFGRLAGKHVNDDVARQILEMVEAPNVALKIYDTMLGWWKTGKTVLNPGTHMRNVLGNIFFSQLAGASIWNPGNVTYYKRAITALRNGGADLMEAYEQGVLGADFVSAELRQTLRQLLPDPATINEEKPDILLGIGKAIGKFIPQILHNPAHRAYNQIAALYQAEDEVFKLATYLKAKEMFADPASRIQHPGSTPQESAAQHVRHWFPYFDIGPSGTLKTLGRTAMPFLSFYRESIRIFGHALKERPIALAAGLSVPSLVTLFSAMAMGLDDDDLEQIKTDMRGKAGKLLGPTPLEGMPLFSMLLPFKSDTGQVQQFDMSAIHPFVDFLGNRVEATSGQDWWQQMWRSIIAAGPVGSLIYSQMTGRDAFGDRQFVENNMTPGEKATARLDNVAKTVLPPLLPGGTGFRTLTTAGERSTNKTFETRSPAQAVLRAVGGLDVRNATPDLYRIADDWRKANNLDTTDGMDFSGSTPASRGRKTLFGLLAQDKPNLEAIKNVTNRLADLGSPIRTPQDVQKLLFYRNPLMVIRGAENQQRFRASLTGLERQALDQALTEYEKIKAKAPALIQMAR